MRCAKFYVILAHVDQHLFFESGVGVGFSDEDQVSADQRKNTEGGACVIGVSARLVGAGVHYIKVYFL